MGVHCSVELETTKTVEKTVEDATHEGYEVSYACYFNAAPPAPFASRSTTSTDSLDDTKSCTD